jgi:hypothetical protein
MKIFGRKPEPQVENIDELRIAFREGILVGIRAGIERACDEIEGMVGSLLDDDVPGMKRKQQAGALMIIEAFDDLQDLLRAHGEHLAEMPTAEAPPWVSAVISDHKGTRPWGGNA